MELYEIRDELEKFVEMDNPTSFTESGEALLSLSRYPDYLSDLFVAQLKAELKDRLNYYKKNTYVHESSKQITVPVKELVHR